MKLLFVDFETYYASDYSLSMKGMTTQKYIHDKRFKVHGVGLARKEGTPQWVPSHLCATVLAKTVPDSVVVCHNASFDASILAWHYGLKPKLILDTVSISRAILGDVLDKFSLDNVSQFLLGVPKSKGLAVSMGKRELTPEEEKILAEYCALGENSDVNLCRRIFLALYHYIPVQEMRIMDWCARCFTEPQLLLDADALRAYHQSVVAQKAKALADCGMDNRDVLMSNPKFAATLELMGVHAPKKISKTTGKETYALAKTDEGLRELLDHEDLRVQALVTARLELKTTQEETRSLQYLEASSFGPWPVDYRYSGATQTHRFSGGMGAGGNPQNLRRGGKIRDSIIAPEGHTLVVGDLSQIELRINLGLADELEALGRLARGEDLYRWFGGIIYNKEPDQISDAERHVAKMAVLGLGYGMGAQKFFDECIKARIAIDQEATATIVKLYRTTFKGIPKLWKFAGSQLNLMLEKKEMRWPEHVPILKTTTEAIMDSPSIELPNQLHIKYHNLSKGTVDNIYKFGCNGKAYHIWGGTVVENVCQALAGCILKEHILKLNSHMPIVMTTHDELVSVVPENEADEKTQLMKEIMSTSPHWWPNLPLDAKVKHSKRYGDAK